jgi:hypothetical protein
MRCDDPLALMTFIDLTDQVWHAGATPASAPVEAANYASRLDGITFLPAANG